MAVTTIHELDVFEQGQVTRMIHEAVASGQGMSWDGYGRIVPWQKGLADFVPLLTTTGYYPQDNHNGFDDVPVQRTDSSDFAQQTAQILNLLSSCSKGKGTPFHATTSTWFLAENFTIKTGQSMCVGAVVLATLTAGFTLTPTSAVTDDLSIANISVATLQDALGSLTRKVAHV